MGGVQVEDLLLKYYIATINFIFTVDLKLFMMDNISNK